MESVMKWTVSLFSTIHFQVNNMAKYRYFNQSTVRLKKKTYSIWILVDAELVSIISGINQKVCPEVLRSQLPVRQVVQHERILRVTTMNLETSPLLHCQVLWSCENFMWLRYSRRLNSVSDNRCGRSHVKPFFVRLRQLRISANI